MTNQIYPCLWFDNQAKTAADFYCSVFKNSTVTVDTPMVVNFELHGKKIMGLNGGTVFKINPSISFFVKCESIDETNEIWDKLIDGGKAMMPIDKYDWSKRYGWLQDKFGLTWQIMLQDEGEILEKITTSMLFTGNVFGKAEEAIQFYSSVFSNSSTEQLSHYPNEDANAGKVLFSEFSLNQYKMIAMDGPGNHEYTFNEAVSFVVDCENQDEIDYYWNKLTADGGQESQCGWLKDKFGISWQIVPTILAKLIADPEKSQRVIQAFMQMKKFEIAKLIQA